jgi:Phosphotransferase enzyme family
VKQGDPSQLRTSISSSVTYSHESFETFAEKLRVVLQLLFTDAYSACTVVYRLQGGGFHRVVAANLLNGAVVIRIPHVSLSDEAAVLSFIRSHSKIPVPRVLKLNTSPESNVFCAPYKVQTKVPGNKLYHIYPTTIYEENRSVVRQIVHLLGQLSQISMSSIGILRQVPMMDRLLLAPLKTTLTQTNMAFIFPMVPTFLRFSLLASISTSITNSAKTLVPNHDCILRSSL